MKPITFELVEMIQEVMFTIQIWNFSLFMLTIQIWHFSLVHYLRTP